MSRRKRNNSSTQPFGGFNPNDIGLMAMMRAADVFSNPSARSGFGTPSLVQGTQYELVRFSYDYWTLITLYRNHWISRRIVDAPVEDMIRAWPKLTSDVDPKELTKLDKAIRRTYTKPAVQKAQQWANLFGGGGALICIKGHENKLDEPLDLDSVPLGGYLGLIPFDRWAGITPEGDPCTDISKPTDFAKPEFYNVTCPKGSSPGGNATGGSFRVHCSRILRFLGPEVPTPEREAQSWWGISCLEPVFEELQKRDNMSWNILNLTFRANLLSITIPTLAQLMSGVGQSQKATQQWYQRMEALNHLMSNQSLIPLDKEGKMEGVQYTFAGLSDCYQQFQLDISGAARMPVTRLWGRTITGLGQANDADERIYEERIGSEQETYMRPQLEKLYPVICMSELGEVPDDLDLTFPSVRVLSEDEKSELAKAVADTVTVCVGGGFMSKQIAAKEMKQASDITGIGTNLTDEFIDTLPEEVEEVDLFGEEGGGDNGGGPEQLSPADSPQKVVRMEAKNKAADADGPASAWRSFHGLDVVIETPKGGERSGPGWSQVMPAHYGFLRGIKGADGDSLDCYFGDGPSNGWVYVVDQLKLGEDAFDEHKCMLNFSSMKEALDTYNRGHHRSKEVYLDVTPMPIASFKQWVKTGNMKRPASLQ